MPKIIKHKDLKEASEELNEYHRIIECVKDLVFSQAGRKITVERMIKKKFGYTLYLPCSRYSSSCDSRWSAQINLLNDKIILECEKLCQHPVSK